MKKTTVDIKYELSKKSEIKNVIPLLSVLPVATRCPKSRSQCAGGWDARRLGHRNWAKEVRTVL